MKKLLLFTFFAAVCSGTVQQAGAQPAAHDSLRALLTQIRENVSNANIRQSTQEALALYKDNSINDQLADKLLLVDVHLLPDGNADRQHKFSYAGLLVRLFQYLQPLGEHHSYATSLNNLGWLYDADGQHAKAVFLYGQALTIREKELGESNPAFIQLLTDRALSYEKKGHYMESIPIYQKILAIRKNTLGEDNYLVFSALKHMIWLYKKTGQYDEALPLSQHALTLTRRMGKVRTGYQLDQWSMNNLWSLDNLAWLYDAMDQYEISCSFYEQALDIRKSVSGKNLSCMPMV